MNLSTAFISGAVEAPSLPLQRFLPPLRPGIASGWLKAHLPEGSTILDPFGASPLLALEAARAGYKVIVAANNPIVRFLLERLADPASYEDLQSAIVSLASIRSGDERLEPEMRALYDSECPACNQRVSARAFIWQHDNQVLQAKILDCEQCGDSGEYPVDTADIEKALSFRREGPHRARALERIASQDHPLRGHAEEALESYLPRAIYAFFTILNRLDRLQTTERQRELIHALLLVALDRGNSIWEHPSGRPRPKQLSNPPTFREHNVWREIEDALELWNSLDYRVPLVEWPAAIPERGGIALFSSSYRKLAKEIDAGQITAVVTALPRPNQAYWTLSALWAGWLWGKEAIGPFASVLRRRRYDWNWHAEALYATFTHLTESLNEGTPMFATMGESEEGFITAAISAANLANFGLEGIALRKDRAEMQLTWTIGKGLAPDKKVLPQLEIQAAITQLLEARSQPSDSLYLQSAGAAQLAQQHTLGLGIEDPGELNSKVRDELEETIRSAPGLVRYGGSAKSLERGQWWLANAKEQRTPIFDRIEIAVVRQLVRKPGQTFEELDQAICNIFPGLLTPESRHLDLILRSYGQLVDGGWQIKAEDQPRARGSDLAEIRDLATSLGQRLFHSQEGIKTICWKREDGSNAYCFYPIASGIVSEIAWTEAKHVAENQVILLPGSRSKLVLAKLEEDPRLKELKTANWHFVKYRHFRRLAENTAITIESFDELLDLDELSEDPIQPPLL